MKPSIKNFNIFSRLYKNSYIYLKDILLNMFYKYYHNFSNPQTSIRIVYFISNEEKLIDIKIFI